MFRWRIAFSIAGPCFHRAATIPNEVMVPDITDRPGAPLVGSSWQTVHRLPRLVISGAEGVIPHGRGEIGKAVAGAVRFEHHLSPVAFGATLGYQ
jgi:hypothetical protein